MAGPLAHHRYKSDVIFVPFQAEERSVIRAQLTTLGMQLRANFEEGEQQSKADCLYNSGKCYYSQLRQNEKCRYAAG